MPRSKSAGNADSKPGDPNQSESLCRETMNDVPAGFLPLSSAINRLADGMWGGLPRPDLVAAIKTQPEEIITWVWPLAGEVRTTPQGRGRKREIGDLRSCQARSPIRR